MLALDTEVTGLDVRHSARPFFVTMCDEEGKQTYWEWPVDPLTRQPIIPPEDIEQIRNIIEVYRNWGNDDYDEEIRERHAIIGHNFRFDISALRTIGIDNIPYAQVRDTLIAAHLLASNSLKDLTSLGVNWIGHDIKPLEDKLEVCVQECRRFVRSRLPNWRIAEYGLEDADGNQMMPSAKKGSTDKQERTWAFDMWLPMAVHRAIERGEIRLDLKKDSEKLPHRSVYKTVLRDYSNADSAITLALWQLFRREIVKRGLWKIYKAKLAVDPIVYGMQTRGVTASRSRLDAMEERYKSESAELKTELQNIAAREGHELELPAGSTNNNLRYFILNVLKLPPQYSKKSKTDAPTLDKDAFNFYKATLTQDSKGYEFIHSLLKKRSIDKDLSDMEGYRRYWLPKHKGKHAQNTDEQRISNEEISKEDKENGQVLGVDGVNTGERVRPVPSVRGSEGTQGKLPSPQGSNTDETESSTHLRQQTLREPRTPIHRNEQGQLSGHDRQGETSEGRQERVEIIPGTIGQREQTTRIKADGATGSGHTANVPQGRSSVQLPSVSRKVRGEKNNDIKNRQTAMLDACGVDNDVYLLFPNINHCGSDTLRWSFKNPNTANVSSKVKGEDEGGSMRSVFGPAPGREWWDIDAKNLELRIPAYESGEQELIDLFEKENEPPYYGSEHLLNFSTIYPDIWEQELREVGIEKVGPHCKDKYKRTNYQWCKNFDFAVGYQAGDATADAAAHRPGSKRRVVQRFARKEALNRRWVDYANKHGFVETIPDKSIDPEKGYPLLCSRSEWGKVSPTIPLSYHVSGTAMWWTIRFMQMIQAQLDEWNEVTGFDGFMTLQVHDSVVLDFPKSQVHPSKINQKDIRQRNLSNLWRIRVIQKLGLKCGENIGVPTPTGCTYCPDNWGEGVEL